jgi:uncharacterized membrane protein YczE
MSRSFRGVILLGLILFLNIVFTQYAVHQFYYENYAATVICALLNLVLFPVAVMIYRKEKHGVSPNEK